MNDDLYFIVACKNCKNAWVVDGTPKTASCTLCNNRYKFKKLKKMYETDDKEEAREALTLKQAQLNGLEDIYEEMVEEVDFSRDVMDSLVPEREVVPSGGGDVERPSSNREWVLEAVRELDEPRDEDVVEWVDERVGLSEEQVFKILDGLCMDGEVIRKRGGFLEIV